jgi:hypothetical protein
VAVQREISPASWGSLPFRPATGGGFLWLDGADSPSASAAIILPARPRRIPPKPDEEREKETHRRQAAKLARLDHQEAANEKAAEAAAVAEFDLNDEQRRRLVLQERS